MNEPRKKSYVKVGLTGSLITAVVFALEVLAPGVDRAFPLVWAVLGLAIVSAALPYVTLLKPAKYQTRIQRPDGTKISKDMLIEGLSRIAAAIVLLTLVYGFVVYRISGNPMLYLLFVPIAVTAALTYWRRLGAIASANPEGE